MSENANQFSRKGDEVFGCFKRRFADAGARRMAFGHALPQARFDQIRTAMLGYLSACLGSPRPLLEERILSELDRRRTKIPGLRADGLMLPKREQITEFNQLHKAVAAAFRDFGIDEHVVEIDLPINVRTVFGKIEGGRAALPFSSTKVHSDVWAGVPVDAVVIVMPVLGDIEHLTIECGEMAPEKELEAMRGMSDYLDGREYRMVEKYDEVSMQHGHVYFADARGLHRTVRRQKSGVRVSIDFRFRLNDPEYTAMCPKVTGPDAVGARVPYPEWLAVGSESLIVFDETMSEAAAKEDTSNGAPFGAEYRMVELFPHAKAA